ncbi:hypothetical protein BOO71_0014371 [Deinococcus marmoris]|uniref:Uncharacterized protein n=1 Tax=Deinococcus marmoris TaxID=249408 RepID=A0A1U7NRP6_9DEIO|nr:hypothetical protein BOO71_0014371 [Deinococcus marmoris]
MDLGGLEVGGQDRAHLRAQLDPLGGAAHALIGRHGELGDAVIQQFLNHDIDGDLRETSLIGKLRACQPAS